MRGRSCGSRSRPTIRRPPSTCSRPAPRRRSSTGRARAGASARPLTASGSYAIEVYLSRAAARRSEAASYTLTVSVNGTTVPAAESACAAPRRRQPRRRPRLLGGDEPRRGRDARRPGRARGGRGGGGRGRGRDAGRQRRMPRRRRPALVPGDRPRRSLGHRVGRRPQPPRGGRAWPRPSRRFRRRRTRRRPPSPSPRSPARPRPHQPLAACGFTVDRVADGGAALRVALPGGGVRIIRFVNGEAVTSDGTGAFTASHDAGVSKIGIGDERFEIPDAVVRGG